MSACAPPPHAHQRAACPGCRRPLRWRWVGGRVRENLYQVLQIHAVVHFDSEVDSRAALKVARGQHPLAGGGGHALGRGALALARRLRRGQIGAEERAKLVRQLPQQVQLLHPCSAPGALSRTRDHPSQHAAPSVSTDCRSHWPAVGHASRFTKTPIVASVR
jgi:hypothetical protein